ncbi:DUF6953 family protein [Serratia fonticola]
MERAEVTQWMLAALQRDKCLYQDDVVDFLIKNKDESHLIENTDGNQVLGRPLLNEFLNLTRDDVVWVRSGFYWRYRVAEDEPGRNARG